MTAALLPIAAAVLAHTAGRLSVRAEIARQRAARRTQP